MVENAAVGTEIRVELTGSLATLWLEGPTRRNAMGRSAWEAMPAALARAEATPGCRAIIIRGSNGHFGAGADIAEFGDVFATRDATIRYFAIMESAMASIEGATKPVVAAIEGVCVGACVALALACDIRLAAPSSCYAITPAKLGIAYPYGDVRRAAAAIGANRVKAMIFSGRPITADIALAYGLVDAVLDGDFETGLSEFVASIAACSPWTIRTTKRALSALRAGAGPSEAGYPDILADAVVGADFKEGLAAFAARRAPRFKD
jgi:enoyl-CoA hydratase/carnithine racemase